MAFHRWQLGLGRGALTLMQFPSKIWMFCWAVTLCVAVVGCSSSDEDAGPGTSPPDETSEALTLPSNHGLAAGSVTVQPGASDEYGDVVVSCPAGGSACVVNVAADGSATYNKTGGMPTVSPVAQAFPRHGVGTSWSFAVDDSDPGFADPEFSLETIAYQITGRQEYRGREVLVTNATTHPPLPLEADLQVLFDAETGNPVATLYGDTVDSEYIPHEGRLSFPMKVGNTWRATYEEVLGETWGEEKAWQDWEVMAYEEVTVPAGTFMAFRVTRTGASNTYDQDDAYTYWYAPTIGFIVKMDDQYADGGHYVLELTDWKLAP